MSALPFITEKVPPRHEALAVDRLTAFETAQAYRLDQAGFLSRVRVVQTLLGIAIAGIPYGTSESDYTEAVAEAVDSVLHMGAVTVREAIAAHGEAPKQSDDPRTWAWSMALALA